MDKITLDKALMHYDFLRTVGANDSVEVEMSYGDLAQIILLLKLVDKVMEEHDYDDN